MNAKIIALVTGMLLIAGCTQQLQAYTVEGVYKSVDTDFNLNVVVTDELRLGTNSLFSGEMTRLTLNLINLAKVPFSNLRAIVINADDLNPTTSADSFPLLESNMSETFEWDLTAPQLGLGEALFLNNIKVRLYYDTYAEATKTILLKEAGDRVYEPTFSSSTGSPLALYFDTSYETVTTLPSSVKNFTVNMIFFNNYSGTIDYYDNTNVQDNYVRQLVLGVDKVLTFYNYLDGSTPWEKVNESMTDEELAALGITRSSLSLKDYYYLRYDTVESQGYDLCTLISSGEQSAFSGLSNRLTEQRRMLWMTRGTTKVNVLRFGAPSVSADTSVELSGRIDYSYSQDFGGEGFGVIVYGLS